MIKKTTPRTQAAWRKWLEKNHSEENEVYLVHYKKHTGKRAMTAQQAMDEAICFGWIDTTINRLDENRYRQKFVKRKKTGRWSKNTLKYGKRLIKEGKMSPTGMKAYKQGLKNPIIDHDIPENSKEIEKLKQSLAKNKKAKEFFDNVAPSHKKMWLRWLTRAKREETKDRRIAKIVELCSQGKKF